MHFIRGIYLLEVLISFVILSIVLLGVDATLLLSFERAKTSFYFSTGAQQLNVMVERINAAKNNAITEQLNEWYKEIQEVLPEGKGTLQEDGFSRVLSIFWGENKENFCQKNQLGKSGCLRVVLKN